MSKRDEHSIHNEPIYRAPPAHSPDSIAQEPAFGTDQPAASDEERALHNVWDEPAFRASGQGVPESALNYSHWYIAGRERTTPWQSWGVVFLLALCGGPFSIAGTLLTSLTQGTGASLLVLVAVGPALEEMMKIGVVLIVLENRPYLFRSGIQVLLAAIISGFMFSVVENILYIYFYHTEGSTTFRIWRWTVCTALHTGATTVAGMGLYRMWQQATTPAPDQTEWTYTRPQASVAYPYIVAAVLIHGLYNGLAVLLQMALGPM